MLNLTLIQALRISVNIWKSLAITGKDKSYYIQKKYIAGCPLCAYSRSALISNYRIGSTKSNMCDYCIKWPLNRKRRHNCEAGGLWTIWAVANTPNKKKQAASTIYKFLKKTYKEELAKKESE